MNFLSANRNSTRYLLASKRCCTDTAELADLNVMSVETKAFDYELFVS